MMVAVTAVGVRREFRGRAVVRGPHLTLEEGEFVALLGRSGTGKIHAPAHPRRARPVLPG